MNEEEAASAGISLAGQAIHKIADGLDDEALALLNAAGEAELRWAAGYLLSCLRESVNTRVRNNPRKLRRALHAGAAGAEQDALMTRVGLILAASDEGESNG